MGGKETDVIGGFNSFLEEQKKLEDDARLTTVLFDERYEILHDGVDIKTVEPITRTDYYVRGSTALLDAIGRTIDNVDSYVQENDKVLFFINTDGYENASYKYTNKQINEMVTHLQNEHDWKFLFLGAGIDAFAVGSTIGISNSFNTSNTTRGISANYAAVSSVTSTFRATKGETLDIRKLKDLDKEDSDTKK
jgi:uncharacterized protein YegL